MRKLCYSLVLLLVCLPIFAQETTPEAVPIVEGIVLNQTTELNGLTIQHPTGWYAINADAGTVMVSNLDLLSIRQDTVIPAGTLIVRLNLYNYSQLTADVAATATSAKQILESIPLPTGEAVAEGTPTPTPPAITEIAVNGKSIARADASRTGTEAAVYLVTVTPRTFIVAITASNEPGVLAQLEPTVTAILASLTLDMTAPLPTTITQYADLEQRTSPEGYPILGRADSPVKVTVVTGFDCLPCRTFYEFGLPMLLQRIRSGDVELTLIPTLGTGTLAGGERAAIGAICAQEQQFFWQMHDALFFWQDYGNNAFIDDRLEGGLTTLGGDVTAYQTCIRSERPLTTLNNAFGFIGTLDTAFRGTPAVLMNGILVNWNPANLNMLVDQARDGTLGITPEATAEVTLEATAEATPEATTAP